MKYLLTTSFLAVTALVTPSAAQSQQELIDAFSEQGVHVDIEKSQITIYDHMGTTGLRMIRRFALQYKRIGIV